MQRGRAGTSITQGKSNHQIVELESGEHPALLEFGARLNREQALETHVA